MESYWHKENFISNKCMYVPGNANRFLRWYFHQCIKYICLRLILLWSATSATPATKRSFLYMLSFVFFPTECITFSSVSFRYQMSASLHSQQEVKHI